ncbi:hypothetical protein V8E55_003379 [Tylopilus felleus]
MSVCSGVLLENSFSFPAILDLTVSSSLQVVLATRGHMSTVSPSPAGRKLSVVFKLAPMVFLQLGNDAEATHLAVAQSLDIKLLIDDNDVSSHPSDCLKGCRCRTYVIDTDKAGCCSRA